MEWMPSNNIRRLLLLLKRQRLSFQRRLTCLGLPKISLIRFDSHNNRGDDDDDDHVTLIDLSGGLDRQKICCGCGKLLFLPLHKFHRHFDD